MNTTKYNYGTAILSAFEYLLKNYTETFIIGQGLWSPWYVGNSMTDLDKKFGKTELLIHLFLNLLPLVPPLVLP